MRTNGPLVSLSGFETPDARLTTSKSDEPDKVKTVEGDVTRVSKCERKADPEGTEDSASVEPKRHVANAIPKPSTICPLAWPANFADDYQSGRIRREISPSRVRLGISFNTS